MPSWINRSTSARVGPVATQPGRSGTYAAQLLGVSSYTTTYFIPISPALRLQPGLPTNAVPSTGWHVIVWRSCDHHCAEFGRVLIDAVAASRAHVDPPILFNCPDRVAHLGHDPAPPGCTHLPASAPGYQRLSRQ